MGIFQKNAFLEKTTLPKYLLILSSFFCKRSKVPTIFVCSACALQLLPLSVLEMTSGQRERRVSPSLLRVSVCYHGSSCHFLPEWVFLCSFIFVCTLQRSYKSALFTLPYMGFYEQRAQGFPQCQKKTMNSVHTHSRYTRACTRSYTHTHTHTARCHAPLRHSKLHPFAHNDLHLQLNGM